MPVRLWTWAIAAILVVGGGFSARADEEGLSDRYELAPETSLFSIELDGSFRWRTELWKDIDLGLYPFHNAYGIMPPLGSDAGSSGQPVRETTDIRFQLKPSLHISERATVHSTIDLFSIGAGSGGFSDIATQMGNAYGVPQPGDFGNPLDSASIRHLWVDIRLFHLLTIQLGRVAAHWGMGILENDGRDLDGDGGDAFDGVTFRLNLPDGMWGSVTLDWPLEGAQVQSPFAPWGTAYDIGDKDDIWQWRLRFVSEAQNTQAPVQFSWGVYARFLMQEYSSPGGDSPSGGCVADYPFQSVYNCDEVFWRDAFVMTPDAWMKLTARIAPDYWLHLEAEIVGRYGTMTATQRFSGKDSGKTLYGVAGAGRITLETPAIEAEVEFGAASGDTGSHAFGVLDRPVVAEPDDSQWEQSPVASNETITSFAFNPGYRVDQILFRRGVGAVTNAFYVKPRLRYLPLPIGDDGGLWVQASVMYAQAFVAESTPGNATGLGVETDLTVGLDLGSHVQARLQGAVLVPMSGIKDGSYIDNLLPWTGRFILNFSF